MWKNKAKAQQGEALEPSSAGKYHRREKDRRRRETASPKV